MRKRIASTCTVAVLTSVLCLGNHNTEFVNTNVIFASAPSSELGLFVTNYNVVSEVELSNNKELFEIDTETIALSASQSGDTPFDESEIPSEESALSLVSNLSLAETETVDDSTYDEYANLAIAQVHNYVNVRSLPSTEGEILGKIYQGAVAEILSEEICDDGLWFHITSGSVEGYIKAEFFIYGEEAASAIDDYVTRYVKINADRLNVRSECDVTSSKIGYLDYNEKVILVENLGDWMKVQYSGERTGYVSSEYVTVIEEFTYAKSIEEELAEIAAQKALAEREAELAAQKAAQEQTTANDTVVASETVTTTAYDSAVADTSYSTNSELRTAIVDYAMQFLGNKYVHGGNSLVTGTDCSGFTSLIYGAYGYSLSRTPSGQLSSAGRSITMEEAQPGDIVCYTSNGSSCTHVALYIGNGQIIHSANSRKGVIISDVYYSTILGVKNVID